LRTLSYLISAVAAVEFSGVELPPIPKPETARTDLASAREKIGKFNQCKARFHSLKYLDFFPASQSKLEFFQAQKQATLNMAQFAAQKCPGNTSCELASLNEYRSAVAACLSHLDLPRLTSLNADFIANATSTGFVPVVVGVIVQDPVSPKHDNNQASAVLGGLKVNNQAPITSVGVVGGWTVNGGSGGSQTAPTPVNIAGVIQVELGTPRSCTADVASLDKQTLLAEPQTRKPVGIAFSDLANKTYNRIVSSHQSTETLSKPSKNPVKIRRDKLTLSIYAQLSRSLRTTPISSGVVTKTLGGRSVRVVKLESDTPGSIKPIFSLRSSSNTPMQLVLERR